MTAASGTRSEGYSYDANGNRTMTGYQTGAGNRLSSDGVYNYAYDDEGNLLTKTRISDGQRTEFVWDYRNRLSGVLVKDASGNVLQDTVFTYDVNDRRIGKWVDPDGPGPLAAVQTWTVYDGANPYADFDGSGSLTTRYLSDPRVLDALFARVAADGTTAWYLRDNIGSVRQVVGPTGTVLDAITYDSFGNVLSETDPAAGDRFKYTGREYDAELGIYYYRARYYDPATGRFLSEDPLGFRAGDANFYRYVGNSPTDRVDPSGLVDPTIYEAWYHYYLAQGYEQKEAAKMAARAAKPFTYPPGFRPLTTSTPTPPPQSPSMWERVTSAGKMVGRVAAPVIAGASVVDGVSGGYYSMLRDRGNDPVTSFFGGLGGGAFNILSQPLALFGGETYREYLIRTGKLRR